MALDALDRAQVEADIAALEASLGDLTGDAALTASQNLEGLRAVLAA